MVKKIDKMQLLWIVVVFVLMIINLILVLKFIIQPNKEESDIQEIKVVSENKEKIQTIYVPKSNEELIKKLATMGERDRMEYYCGVYFKHIEKGEYEEAYNLLYSEFKQKYFPELDDFKKYVKKTYPKEYALEYDDISRQGYIYVLKLKILDVLGSKENNKSQRIVVKENTYNDFVVSFQVI